MLRALSEGQSPRSVSDAFGVVRPPPRDDEESLAAVGSANVGSSNVEPDRIIPERGKVSENSGDCGLGDGDSIDANGRASAGDVLPHRDCGPKLANDARLFGPQTASLTFEASALPCERQVLTWRAPTEEVDARGVVLADGSHVIETKGRRPVAGEDAAAPRVGLALKHRVDIEASITQGAFETELETAYPTEQRPEREARAGDERRAHGPTSTRTAAPAAVGVTVTVTRATRGCVAHASPPPAASAAPIAARGHRERSVTATPCVEGGGDSAAGAGRAAPTAPTTTRRGGGRAAPPCSRRG